MYLGRDDILKAKDLPRLAIEVPEWSGTVLIARLPSGVRLAYHNYMLGLPDGSFEHVARLVALTLVDVEGERLFTDEDVEALNHKSPAALIRIFKAASEHNRLGDTEVTRAQGESEPSRFSGTV